MGECDKMCGRYSDFDVYFKDGECESLCAHHAHDKSIADIVTQVVPQRGDDHLNQVIPQSRHKR